MEYIGQSIHLETKEITQWKIDKIIITNDDIYGYGVSIYRNKEFFCIIYGNRKNIKKINFEENNNIKNIIEYSISIINDSFIIMNSGFSEAIIKKLKF
jgi:hypothetical protein